MPLAEYAVGFFVWHIEVDRSFLFAFFGGSAFLWRTAGGVGFALSHCVPSMRMDLSCECLQEERLWQGEKEVFSGKVDRGVFGSHQVLGDES